jgi:hypothetical protein
MDETRIIRGRRVVFERAEPREPAEYLRYTLDVYDERGSLVEVLGRVADLAVAHAAFDAAVAKYPDKRICIRERCRVIGSSDRPGVIDNPTPARSTMRSASRAP